MNKVFPKGKITSVQDVEEFFHFLVFDLQVNFHPDDSFDQYINMDTKEPSFTPEECIFYDILMDQSFEVCEREGVDIYEIGLDTLKSNWE